MDTPQEKSPLRLSRFLEGARLCGMHDWERQKLGMHTGRQSDEADLCRITLANGKEIVAEGGFSEPVPGFLLAWTPFEQETFMLIQIVQIASIAYSECTR